MFGRFCYIFYDGQMRRISALCAAAAVHAAYPIHAQTLIDATDASGIEFVHQTGATGAFYFPEITGSGAGLVDWDNDGDLDAYLVQSGSVTGNSDGSPVDQLFRNDLDAGDGPGSLRFARVTEESRATVAGYGMGVAAGDIDNDGLTDLYVTQYGRNVMLRNLGGGRFADVSAESGTDIGDWSTSATFFDYDRDGWLDLFVVNYVAFSAKENPSCYAATSRRDYCGPSDFEPRPDRLLRNLGNGRFQDVTLPALGEHRAGPGLGVVATDLNQDGWLDLYVANDGEHNHLWLNHQGLRFQEDALFAGVAVNQRGVAEAGMGVAAADFDEDGDVDLFVTHLMGETNTLYRNDGDAGFLDVTAPTGLGAVSRGYTGWATRWLDLDLDGWLDLVSFNGAVRVLETQAQTGDPYPFRQRNQLFISQAGQSFVEVPAAESGALGQLASSRGAAFGDVDNDGDVDVLLNNGNDRARLLLNPRTPRRWLGLRLVSGEGDQPGAGAVLSFDRGRPQHRQVRADGSYASANDPRLLFHWTSGQQPQSLEIIWADGTRQSVGVPATGRYTTLRREP